MNNCAKHWLMDFERINDCSNFWVMDFPLKLDVRISSE